MSCTLYVFIILGCFRAFFGGVLPNNLQKKVNVFRQFHLQDRPIPWAALSQSLINSQPSAEK